MITDILNKIFQRASSDESADAVLTKVETLSGSIIPKNRSLYVFSDDELVNVCSKIPPSKRGPGEAWWLVPFGELTLRVEIETDGITMAVDVRTSFETDTDLFRLIDGRDRVTTDDLVCLMTSQLAGS